MLDKLIELTELKIMSSYSTRYINERVRTRVQDWSTRTRARTLTELLAKARVIYTPSERNQISQEEDSVSKKDCQEFLFPLEKGKHLFSDSL